MTTLSPPSSSHSASPVDPLLLPRPESSYHKFFENWPALEEQIGKEVMEDKPNYLFRLGRIHCPGVHKALHTRLIRLLSTCGDAPVCVIAAFGQEWFDVNFEVLTGDGTRKTLLELLLLYGCKQAALALVAGPNTYLSDKAYLVSDLMYQEVDLTKRDYHLLAVDNGHPALFNALLEKPHLPVSHQVLKRLISKDDPDLFRAALGHRSCVCLYPEMLVELCVFSNKGGERTLALIFQYYPHLDPNCGFDPESVSHPLQRAIASCHEGRIKILLDQPRLLVAKGYLVNNFFLVSSLKDHPRLGPGRVRGYGGLEESPAFNRPAREVITISL